MSASYRQAKVEPNLTPILDMVFQLITFFMLVVNFKGQALDMALQLPVLGSARPVETEAEAGLLVLNIDAKGRVTVFNKETNIHEFIPAQAALKGRELLKDGQAWKPGDELPTTVVIRGDKLTPVRIVDEVITTCQTAGYRKFALKAMNRSASQ